MCHGQVIRVSYWSLVDGHPFENGDLLINQAIFFRASMKWDDHKQEKRLISDMIISYHITISQLHPPQKCLKHPQNWNQSDWFRENLYQKTIKFSLNQSNWCNVAGGPNGAMVVSRCPRCLGPTGPRDRCRPPRGYRGELGVLDVELRCLEKFWWPRCSPSLISLEWWWMREMIHWLVPQFRLVK